MEWTDIYTLEERLDGLLDKDALHYPQREDIVIKRFFSPEGVYGRIYWSGKEWDAAEQPVWDRRARHGVTRGSRAGKFCNGFYERNTLIMPKQEYEGHGTVYISNASVRSDRMPQRLRMLKEAGVRWLQLPEAALELLMAYGDGDALSGLGLTYMEAINCRNAELCREAEEAFGCPVAAVWTSPLLGHYAYAERVSEKPSFIEGQIAIEEDGGRTFVSALKNSVTRLRHYKADLWAADAAAGTVRIGDVALPKETLYFPAEIINEKTGRIVLQMEASVDGDGKIRIHFGIRPSYWGWRGELERMYRERLEGLLGMPLEISYKHTKGWLPEREGA